MDDAERDAADAAGPHPPGMPPGGAAGGFANVDEEGRATQRGLGFGAHSPPRADHHRGGFGGIGGGGGGGGGRFHMGGDEHDHRGGGRVVASLPGVPD